MVTLPGAFAIMESTLDVCETVPVAFRQVLTFYHKIVATVEVERGLCYIAADGSIQRFPEDNFKQPKENQRLSTTNSPTFAAVTLSGATANKLARFDASKNLVSYDLVAADIPAIADAQVASGAAIAWSKISKTGAVASDVGAASAADLTNYLSLSGGTIVPGGMIHFNQSVGSYGVAGGIWGQVGDDDWWGIRGGSTGPNAGYLEIATGDDGTSAAEPIYVRQYLGGFDGTITRTLTLLDGAGNTGIPGTLSVSGLSAGGIVKAAASTGLQSIASAGTDYVVPSGSITGSAATLTTGRTFRIGKSGFAAEKSFNGSENVAWTMNDIGDPGFVAGQTTAGNTWRLGIGTLGHDEETRLDLTGTLGIAINLFTGNGTSYYSSLRTDPANGAVMFSDYSHTAWALIDNPIVINQGSGAEITLGGSTSRPVNVTSKLQIGGVDRVTAIGGFVGTSLQISGATASKLARFDASKNLVSYDLVAGDITTALGYTPEPNTSLISLMIATQTYPANNQSPISPGYTFPANFWTAGKEVVITMDIACGTALGGIYWLFGSQHTCGGTFNVGMNNVVITIHCTEGGAAAKVNIARDNKISGGSPVHVGVYSLEAFTFDATASQAVGLFSNVPDGATVYAYNARMQIVG